ncbi:hypothetical protein AWB68_04387 [Caballeronia choica]|uniref:Uncharacterized protein n=1 Tax=Caballeronia choica TaxID=326476 RepID=A0A158JXZ6_9BURK|nr:hypothetical protein [Caballeronia choica]SAL73221.1 hypothetical protein AWB68_04387 [Caballeronia choica]
MKRQDISFVEKIGPHCQVKAEQPPLFLEEQIAPLLHKTTRSCRASKRRTIIEHETDFWKAAQLLPFSAANIMGFNLSDWFPRAPGVCWSRYGVKARRSLDGCHEENDPLLGTIYSPQGKLSFIEHGGVGTIRLRPRLIDEIPCHLASAVAGEQCAGGILLAIPLDILANIAESVGCKANIYAEVRFLDELELEEPAAAVHLASPLRLDRRRVARRPPKISCHGRTKWVALRSDPRTTSPSCLQQPIG